ncbi:hypothetical protein KAFR_0H01970 [Kazachstania africana CBS 2517]|uniref:Cytidine deaminase n=1 Tax=Kazachstania africana (strain ATCC 22294 / BCRC 22015 / CBS 2517 / CECT 1963 / NBRC 1671 / NRRL Y-8276) TaxID=1071382 RepID=H2AZ50_KAZAF|nr:hypothetical protein KAFR_0H01970 [Kazachstania africana CBS 2517]CCF59606.1 hypothetical protein KAFR_0H01970 [Kazachstania africana CBS 2517]
MSIQLTSEKFYTLRDKVLYARTKAYCPYSKFFVGAVILTKDGDYVSGCNVENSSYGGTICAERTAVVKSISEGIPKEDWVCLAVIGGHEKIVSPCGICRQFLSEFVPGHFPVIMFSGDGSRHKLMTMNELLPENFNSEFL